MSGLTLDAGGLIALDRRQREVVGRLHRLRRAGHPVTISAAALAQAVRAPQLQVALMRLVRGRGTIVRSLDLADALEVGRLLATSGTADVVDAHVVVCARRAGQPVLTSDVGDLRRLDPGLALIAC